jgi:hypothetical protein
VQYGPVQFSTLKNDNYSHWQNYANNDVHSFNFSLHHCFHFCSISLLKKGCLLENSILVFIFFWCLSVFYVHSLITLPKHARCKSPAWRLCMEADGLRPTIPLGVFSKPRMTSRGERHPGSILAEEIHNSLAWCPDAIGSPPVEQQRKQINLQK